MRFHHALIYAAVIALLPSGLASHPHPGDDEESVAEPFVVDERPALPLPPGTEPVSVCGFQDDLQDVELYDGTLGVTTGYVAENERSTAQLQWIGRNDMRRAFPKHRLGNVADERWCTGTMISDTQMLTAGHCFDVQRGSSGWISPYEPSPDGPQWLPPRELARLMQVNFNYQLSRETNELHVADSFPIVELEEYRLGNLDYAIVTIGANEGGMMPRDLGYPTAPLATSSSADGDLLAIIQHPQGKPKKIEAGAMLRNFGSNLYYGNIDTHGGSSGSGVRDRNGHIVGVHTNGGCTTTGGANRGVSLSAIRAASDIL